MQPGQIIEAQRAIALFGTAVAQGQQPGQPPPTAPGGGIGDHVGRAIGKYQPRADRQLEAQIGRFGLQLAQRDMRLHDAGHRVAIGNADAVMAKLDSLAQHIAGGRRAAQEGKMRRGRHLGKAGHANRPCRYQPGSGFSVP